MPAASTPTAAPPPSSTPAQPSPRPPSTPPAPPTASPTPHPTPTPDPYGGLTVEALASRTYGGGAFEVEATLARAGDFTRYLIRYESDGLDVYGFMNVPSGEGPFPVVLVLHGYVDPVGYDVLAYTTRYADALARLGYLVIHPNYRNYPPSDYGSNLFRVGFAVDVLNLLALVRERGGQPGPLQAADGSRIGLFGHSMGGGIALRVITVDPRVRAAVLYGSMSGDERRNFEKIWEWSNGRSGAEELAAPEEALRRISPIYHLERIQAAVSVHHGEADSVVPPEWSRELCERLAGLGKTVECFFYPGAPHTFSGAAEQLLLDRAAAFFGRYLRP